MNGPLATPPPSNGSENQPPTVPFRDNLNIHQVCPDCKVFPPDLIEENSDLICGQCGRVLDERLISYESEWRTFNSDEKGGDDPNRVGETENELLYGSSGTTIGGGGMNMSKETRKLKKAQAMQNEDKNNRILTGAYNQIDGWAEADAITANVRNVAKGYYKKVYDAGAFRGKNTTAVLASCLFIACRSQGVQRSFAEIMNLTKVPKKDIGRIFKQLEKFFGEQGKAQITAIEDEGGIVNREALEFKNTMSGRPEDMVQRFGNMLGLRFRVRAIAEELATQIPTIAGVAGRSPLSNAGSCLYFAAHLLGTPKPSSQISHVINVSDATIKHAYKYLYQEKDRLVKQDWIGPQPQSVKEGGPVLVGKVSNLPSS